MDVKTFDGVSVYLIDNCPFLLTGGPPNPDKIGVQQMTSSSINNICGPNSLALCVVAFLSADDVKDVKVKENVLDSVRKSKTLRVSA